jgi:hypothetical protein
VPIPNSLRAHQRSVKRNKHDANTLSYLNTYEAILCQSTQFNLTIRLSAHWRIHSLRDHRTPARQVTPNRFPSRFELRISSFEFHPVISLISTISLISRKPVPHPAQTTQLSPDCNVLYSMPRPPKFLPAAGGEERYSA